MGSFSRRRQFPGFYVCLQDSLLRREKLTIPLDFYKHTTGKEPKKSRLQTAAGTWLVDVKQIGEKFCFKQGWMTFVEENGLKSGETLVFHYSGKWKFYVEIYGRNDCKKMFAKARKIDRTLADDFNVESDSDSDTDTDPYMNRDLMFEEKSHSSSEVMEARGDEVPEPYFKLTIHPTHVNTGPVLTPRSFLRNKRKPNQVMLQLANRSNNKSWNVKWIHPDDSTHSSRFCGGWTMFAREANLRVGNVCIFKLIEINDAAAVMEVYVYRAEV